MKKCPTCDLNYIEDCEDECSLCRERKCGLQSLSKSMGSNMEKFIFRKGLAIADKTDIRELKVWRGSEQILVYNQNNECVGVVFSHDEKTASAHGQAEIGFYEKYNNKYGQWHRIFIGNNVKERLKFEKLNKIIDENNFFEYYANLKFVNK